jgi:hypothetical protein
MAGSGLQDKHDIRQKEGLGSGNVIALVFSTLAELCGPTLECDMTGTFWLTLEQVDRRRPPSPKVRGRARVDSRQVLSGILNILPNGLKWQVAPATYSPSTTLRDILTR